MLRTAAPTAPTRQPARPIRPTPPQIDVHGLRVELTGRRGKPRRVLLSDCSFRIAPAEVTAIAGGSGAGKSTLLTSLAGVRTPASGSIRFNGADLGHNLATIRAGLGYVPQDDIVHPELTVERTLRYAAELRLPPETTASERNAVVAEVLDELGLTAQAGQRVGSLSGGQRKRVSIGVELLTQPTAFFLDEPTSGLDPATGRGMMRLLRRLATEGSTVVLTTHAPQDLTLCDRVIFLGPSGTLAFAGPPAEALQYFEAGSFEEIYERLAAITPGEDFRVSTPDTPPAEPPSDPATLPQRRTHGALRQWSVLTRRSFETLVRNRLTLAILAGSPLLVIAMFAVLFRAGAFDPADPSPTAVLMILYWVAFAAFFFGLTYGLLMICTELPIFRRERLVNLHVLPYVAAKLTVLFPALTLILVLMLAVLRTFDRLPSGGLDLYGPLFVTLLLEGIAAITLGLLASALVTRPEQATLALPMLCFPQVLFSGAIIPVPTMALAGRVISWGMADRWAFEALGTSTDVNDLLTQGNALGAPLLAEYGSSFNGPVATDWLILAASTGVCLALTCLALARKPLAH